MSVRIIRKSINRALYSNHVNAVVRNKYSYEDVSNTEMRIEKNTDSSLNAEYAIIVEVSDDAISNKEELASLYGKTLSFAQSKGINSIAMELFPYYGSGISFGESFSVALETIGNAVNNDGICIDVIIALDDYTQKRILDIVPSAVKRKSRVRHSSGSNYQLGFAFMTITRDAYDPGLGEFEIEIPDDLLTELKNQANYDKYYDGDNTASELLSAYADQHELSKLEVVQSVSPYIGQSSVYNALNPKYKGSGLSKKTIFYVALAMGMSAYETESVLNTVNERFYNDAIDIVYKYALNNHWTPQTVHATLASKVIDLVLFE